MSPLRWDVLAVAFVLAIPLLALGLRGDLEWSDVTSRLPWCLLAAERLPRRPNETCGQPDRTLAVIQPLLR